MADIANHLRRNFVSHTRKVQSLFKRVVRNEESHHHDVHERLFVWATIRAEFDKHKNVKDLRIAKMLIEETEKKLFLNQHPAPMKFIFSPGGVCYNRGDDFVDAVLDSFHPIEKAAYPHFFEKREKLKQEYIEMWEKASNKNDVQTSNH